MRNVSKKVWACLKLCFFEAWFVQGSPVTQKRENSFAAKAVVSLRGFVMQQGLGHDLDVLRGHVRDHVPSMAHRLCASLVPVCGSRSRMLARISLNGEWLRYKIPFLFVLSTTLKCLLIAGSLQTSSVVYGVLKEQATAFHPGQTLASCLCQFRERKTVCNVRKHKPLCTATIILPLALVLT